MSAVTKRAVHTVRHEYIVPSPSARAEVEKAISWALSDMPEEAGRSDDDLTVEARDDEIVVWWAEEDKRG